MGLGSKNDGWYVSEALWQRMELLLPLESPTHSGAKTRAFPTGLPSGSCSLLRDEHFTPVVCAA